MGKTKQKNTNSAFVWEPPEDDPLYDNPIKAAALHAKALKGDKEAAAELKRMEEGDWPPKLKK